MKMLRCALLTGLAFTAGVATAAAQNGATNPSTGPTAGADDNGVAPPGPRPAQPEIPALQALPAQLSKLLEEGVPLNPDRTVLLDKKKNRVLLHTQVACNDCLLEMFCCLEQTKEHESILVLRGMAKTVHVGLLAAGAEPGRPAEFTPEFKPPTGQQIDIFVNWVDDKGQLQRCDARKWMRHSVSRYYSQHLPSPPPGVKLPLMELRYDPFNKEILWFGQMSVEQRDQLLKLWDDKQYQQAIRKFSTQSQPRPMDVEFVFAGSYQWKPEGAAAEVYAAEGGELICVANFASSVIDVKEASSASDGGQSYEAWPGRVPPRGTPVIVELVPVRAAVKSNSEPGAKPTERTE